LAIKSGSRKGVRGGNVNGGEGGRDKVVVVRVDGDDGRLDSGVSGRLSGVGVLGRSKVWS
jgi:hypothetical protein